MRLTASSAPVRHKPVTATTSVPSPRPPEVISVTASSQQDGQVRAMYAELTSHVLWQRQAATLAVSVPPPPSPPAPPQPKPVATTPPVTSAPPVSAPAPSGSAQQIAMAMLASYGWSSSEFSCLDPLWEHESGWNVYASNPGSGAYGIPQALPGSKMASAGPDWLTDAATQIRWGLSYIQASYGSPCAAWSHEQATGWY
jgi:hypothetical protein